MLPLDLVVISYVIGSIPFSFLVARALAGADIRREGSRNVGATNVTRTVGKWAGALALVLDFAKGYTTVEIARWIVGRPDWPFAAASANPIHSREMWIALAGLVAVLGHMFPVWLRFHGGKGVATAGGVFLALDPVVVLAAIIVWLIVVLSTRFVSLASILAATSIPLFMRFLVRDAPFWRIVISIIIAVIVIVKHHSNIARLTQGIEQRMGQKKSGE
ncbi:MAG TPA: glycerol-3-phosphate 1-O-acyltransferase PlsY [Thermoanaerobaculia bacterium]|nr:glycerol-3-phosphate 1-O-acyltransferase PlsY [Thermoanaerobaculia bacterium]